MTKRTLVIINIVFVVIVISGAILWSHTITGLHYTISRLQTRKLLLATVGAENTEIKSYLQILDMLDSGQVADATRRLQRILYIQIATEVRWDTIEGSDELRRQRNMLMKEVAKYHQKHESEIDPTIPSNMRAIERLRSVSQSQ